MPMEPNLNLIGQLSHPSPRVRIHRPPRYNPEFLRSDNELRSYLLGLIMADGWICRNTVFISLSDQQIIEDIAHLVDFKNKITTSDKNGFKGGPGKRSYRLGFTGEMYEFFAEQGFTHRKTGHEFIPNAVSADTFRHFLRGLSDGDGYFSLTTNRGKPKLEWGLTSANFDFLAELLVRMLKECDLSFRSRRPLKHGSAWKIQLSHQDAISVGSYIYDQSTIFLHRKHAVWLSGCQVPIDLKKWTYSEVVTANHGGCPEGRSLDMASAIRRNLKNNPLSTLL